MCLFSSVVIFAIAQLMELGGDNDFGYAQWRVPIVRLQSKAATSPLAMRLGTSEKTRPAKRGRRVISP